MGRRSSTLAAFNNPTSAAYGIPTYPWNGAPNLFSELAFPPQPQGRALQWRIR